MAAGLEPFVLWEVVLGPSTGALPPVQGWEPNPVAVGDFVVAACSPGGRGQVVACDRSTGARRWTHPLDYLGGRAVRVGGSLLATSARTLYALEPASGGVVWSWRPTDEPGEWIYTTPAVDGGTCFVADRRGSLSRLSAVDGAVQWSVRPFAEEPAQVNASPVVVDDLVVAADLRGRVFALERATGALRWVAALPEASISALSCTSRGAVVVRTEHAVAELASGSGAVLGEWRAERPLWHHAVWGEGVVAVVRGAGGEEPRERVDHGSIVRLRGGEVLWEAEACGGHSVVRVLPAQGVVVEVSAFDLRVLDLATGEPRWQISDPADFGTALPDVADGVLYRLVDRWDLPEPDEPEDAGAESEAGIGQQGVLQALDWSRLMAGC